MILHPVLYHHECATASLDEHIRPLTYLIGPNLVSIVLSLADV